MASLHTALFNTPTVLHGSSTPRAAASEFCKSWRKCAKPVTGGRFTAATRSRADVGPAASAQFVMIGSSSPMSHDTELSLCGTCRTRVAAAFPQRSPNLWVDHERLHPAGGYVDERSLIRDGACRNSRARSASA